MEMYPRGDGHVIFEVLAYGRHSQPPPAYVSSSDWARCSIDSRTGTGTPSRRLPTCSTRATNRGAAVKHPYNVTTTAVVGDSCLWISTEGVGTFAFDTVRDTSSKQGEWALPFRGNAEHVAEHDLWFGLSRHGDKLCALRQHPPPFDAELPAGGLQRKRERGGGGGGRERR
uniref:Uncharacterized protein n=1 Tax=Oryza glumipatula TaxID=40148 RepID=A0A0D9ZGA5_9ORYZ